MFTPLLELVCEIDEYVSLVWTSSFAEAGDFRIAMRRGSLWACELKRGRILIPVGDETHCGIVTELRLTMAGGSVGSERVTAIGYELVHILSWRRVLPTAGCARYEHAGAAETVLKTLVASQCGAYALPASRRFDRASGSCADLVVAPDEGRGDAYLVSSRFATVLAEVERCAWTTGAGPAIRVDVRERRFVFDVRFGTDRREGQCANPRALFAAAFDTLSDAELRRSDLLWRNCIIVGGSGSGAGRLVATVFAGEEPCGMDRREEFLDARELGTEAELRARARTRLLECGCEDFFEASAPASAAPALPANQAAGLVYGVDYALGDLVTVRAFGETRDARITSVTECRYAGGCDFRLGFDRPYPELSWLTARYRQDTEAILNTAEG